MTTAPVLALYDLSKPTDASSCGLGGVLPASTSQRDETRMATIADAELLSVEKLIKKRWPEHSSNVPMDAREHVQVKSEVPVKETHGDPLKPAEQIKKPRLALIYSGDIVSRL